MSVVLPTALNPFSGPVRGNDLNTAILSTFGQDNTLAQSVNAILTVLGGGGAALNVPAANVSSGTFGSALSDAGTYTFSHAMTVTGLATLTGGATLGAALLAGTDNSFDIGASDATRFRNLFLANNATIGGALTVTGKITAGTGSLPTAGFLNLANNQAVAWRNSTNTADVQLFVNTSDQLQYFRAAGATFLTDNVVLSGSIASNGTGSSLVAGPLTLGTTSVATTHEFLTILSGYTSDLTARAVTWRDGSNVVGQIDTRYDGAAVRMVFGHCYLSGYQTADTLTLIGLDATFARAGTFGGTISTTGTGGSIALNADGTQGLEVRVGSTVYGTFGTILSSAAAFMAHNARQTTTGVDDWTQSNGGAKSFLFKAETSGGFTWFQANAGTAHNTLASFWGSALMTLSAGGALGVSGSVTVGSTLQLGNTYTATPTIGTGYLTVKDAAGTTYKVLVST